jgi:hypothetical protein
VLRRDDDFAADYARRDVDEYVALVTETARGLFGDDDVPGGPFTAGVAALVVPGGDENHTPEVARRLAGSLPDSQLWGVPPEVQTAETAPARVRDFLQQ